MKTINAQRCKAVREKKKLLGLKKIEVFIADNAEAKANLHMYVSYLNQKYNMMKIGE